MRCTTSIWCKGRLNISTINRSELWVLACVLPSPWSCRSGGSGCRSRCPCPGPCGAGYRWCRPPAPGSRPSHFLGHRLLPWTHKNTKADVNTAASAETHSLHILCRPGSVKVVKSLSSTFHLRPASCLWGPVCDLTLGIWTPGGSGAQQLVFWIFSVLINSFVLLQHCNTFWSGSPKVWFTSLEGNPASTRFYHIS